MKIRKLAIVLPAIALFGACTGYVILRLTNRPVTSAGPGIFEAAAIAIARTYEPANSKLVIEHYKP